GHTRDGSPFGRKQEGEQSLTDNTTLKRSHKNRKGDEGHEQRGTDKTPDADPPALLGGQVGSSKPVAGVHQSECWQAVQENRDQRAYQLIKSVGLGAVMNNGNQKEQYPKTYDKIRREQPETTVVHKVGHIGERLSVLTSSTPKTRALYLVLLAEQTW
ncbi:MAG: hypothetical protein ACI9CA_002447, partial [Natronomonas sp.]